MRRLRVLDLFSGLNGWGAPWKEAGDDVVSLDFIPDFNPTICADILDMDVVDTPEGPMLVAPDGTRYGPFDVVLASPPCTAFSVQSIGRHWHRDHRPKTHDAIEARAIVLHTLYLIRRLKPRWWWLENPRGKLRKMPFMAPLQRVTVWYCRYNDFHRDDAELPRAKPTDLWGHWPSTWAPRPECRNGNPDHTASPRGSATGTQGMGTAEEKSLIPRELSIEVREAVLAALEA